MVKEVKMYTIKCDRCGKVYENDEYSAWDDSDWAKECAHEDNWISITKKDFCPNCYNYNEEIDDFIIKPPIPSHVFQLKTALEYTRFFMDKFKGKAILSETDDEYILEMSVPNQHIPIEYIKNLMKSCKYDCIEYVQKGKSYNILNIKISK